MLILFVLNLVCQGSSSRNREDRQNNMLPAQNLTQNLISSRRIVKSCVHLTYIHLNKLSQSTRLDGGQPPNFGIDDHEEELSLCK